MSLKEKAPNQTTILGYRNLRPDEISILVQNQNTAEDWENVFVKDGFSPEIVKACSFYGNVFLGKSELKSKSINGIAYPIGIYNTTITNSTIGKNACVHNVRLIANYIIGNDCVLLNINELIASEDLSKNSKNSSSVWVNIANENGGRKVLAFPGMHPADAVFWAKFPHDKKLRAGLIKMTTHSQKSQLSQANKIGDYTVIKNTNSALNLTTGMFAIIDGASKLMNLTVQSSEQEPSLIGSEVDLRNGIVGFANNIDSKVMANNFITGQNVNLQYGARIMETFVGDNSNISCCEVLNNFIFPFHEQHHNNSFLIATTLMGQSNIAAGATIGSNHNSRAADGEIIAKRGFWPGLSTSFKHNSKFASFTLVAKGNYNSELNITLPFSLVSVLPNQIDIRLFPGFWFKYNLYALARNSWKFEQRDKRRIKAQVIETDFLAPDTIEEMLAGIELLLQSINNQTGQSLSLPALRKDKDKLEKELTLLLEGQVNKGKAEVLKPVQSILLYRNLIMFYCVRTILDKFPPVGLKNLIDSTVDWLNFGGQIISRIDINRILEGIRNGRIDSWEAVHVAYADSHANYSSAKYDHALNVLQRLANMESFSLNSKGMYYILDEFITITQQLMDWVIKSRSKDYTAPFRKIVYETPQEMDAVLGKIEDNSFLIYYQKTMNGYIQKATHIKNQMD